MPLGVRQRVRRTGADGAGPTEIARALGISRNTVVRYASTGDLSPAPPLAPERAKPATGPLTGWVPEALSDGLSAPGRRRHTARRIYDRLVEEEGYAGYCATVRGFVRGRGLAQRPSPGDGYPGPGWAPGTMQDACGDFVATVAGRGPGPEMLAPAPRNRGRGAAWRRGARGRGASARVSQGSSGSSAGCRARWCPATRPRPVGCSSGR